MKMTVARLMIVCIYCLFAVAAATVANSTTNTTTGTTNATSTRTAPVPTAVPVPTVPPSVCHTKTQRCCYKYTKCGVREVVKKVVVACPYERCGIRTCTPKCRRTNKYVPRGGRHVRTHKQVCTKECRNICKKFNAKCGKFAIYHMTRFCVRRSCGKVIDPVLSGAAAKVPATLYGVQTFVKHTKGVRHPNH